MWRDWTLAVKNVFLPTFCRLCDARLLTEENGYFCPACWAASPRVMRPFCSICGRPHRGAVGFGTQSNFPCADCRDAAKPPPYRRIFGAALYDGAVQDAVKLLKFYDKPRLALPLAALMAEFAAEEMEPARYELLIPVPLHKVRERERGFNQSRLLAEALLPAFPDSRVDESLQRIRPTRVQSRAVTAAERRANVRGAFAVAGGAVAGRRVLLIDDVVTTGGTIVECARALQRAGAAEVDVLAAAVTARPFQP